MHPRLLSRVVLATGLPGPQCFLTRRECAAGEIVRFVSADVSRRLTEVYTDKGRGRPAGRFRKQYGRDGVTAQIRVAAVCRLRRQLGNLGRHPGQREGGIRGARAGVAQALRALRIILRQSQCLEYGLIGMQLELGEVKRASPQLTGPLANRVRLTRRKARRHLDERRRQGRRAGRRRAAAR
jgi:hypothetical protein